MEPYISISTLIVLIAGILLLRRRTGQRGNAMNGRTARVARNPKEIIIKDTHRGLVYKDGVLDKVLSAGRYEYPKSRLVVDLFQRVPETEVVLVDVRERDMTIKGQEI